MPLHTSLLQDVDGENFFAYIVPILSTRPGARSFTKVGSCVVVSNAESMERIISDIQRSENSGFFILDRDNKIMAANKKEERGKKYESLYSFSIDRNVYNSTQTDRQKKTIVQYHLLKNTGWKVVSLIPEEELSSDLQSVRRFGLLLGFVMILALGISVTAIVRNQRKYHEIELLKKEAELAALQNQINPHFLYNTLNCISSIALVNDISEIVTISEAVVRIFRYSLEQSDLVYFQDEIAVIRDYMEIMNIRYPRRFTLHISFDKQIVRLKTIKMILQPLVENAVYHGLEPKNGPGGLTISGRMASENVIQICIEDNGKGIGANELAELQKVLASPEETGAGVKRGIGLININRRVKLMFGREYGVSIESRENTGTRIVILLPIMNSS
jgi:two-component system sensor histidine kinase YesM